MIHSGIIGASRKGREWKTRSECGVVVRVVFWAFLPERKNLLTYLVKGRRLI